ncbi:MAG: hypothetical protein R3277_11735 [Brumimicrobium sp.]|nr:hypothetical protein [Brumimicrobium sp.]
MRSGSLVLVLLSCVLLTFAACKSKEPTVLKVYVRSNNHILVPDATVRIIGDISEGTPEYFEETTTNSGGVAFFNLDELFDSFDKEKNTAYFTLYAKDTTDLYTSKKIRTKMNLTTVESITLSE